MEGTPNAWTRKDARHLLEESAELLRRAGGKVPEETAARVRGLRTALEAALGETGDDAYRAAAVALDEEVGRSLAFARKSRTREYVESIGSAVLVALVLRAFIIEAFQIPTASMEPTLLVGDHLFVSKFSYGARLPFTNRYLWRWGTPERGDIAVFQFPVEEVRAQLDIGGMMRLAESYRRRTGAYPESMEAAATGSSNVPPASDPWGTPYRHDPDGDRFRVRSAGPDGVFNTGDDLHEGNTAFGRGSHACVDDSSLVSAKDYIKRIIGLPGDRISMKNNVLHVNDVPVGREELGPDTSARPGMFGARLARETLDSGTTYTVAYRDLGQDFDEIVVREGHVFTMGDNRDNSSDGRCWGQVPIENTKGTALFIFFSRDARDGVRWQRFFQPIH